MRRCLLVVLLLAGCGAHVGGGAANDAAGALANVAIASGVGAARVAEGDCFTICAPGTVCNPKTKLCDTIPCHGTCASNEVCDTSGPLDRCVKAPGLSVAQKHDISSGPQLPVQVAPPLSSAPPSSPQHPDVPPAAR